MWWQMAGHCTTGMQSWLACDCAGRQAREHATSVSCRKAARFVHMDRSERSRAQVQLAYCSRLEAQHVDHPALSPLSVCPLSPMPHPRNKPLSASVRALLPSTCQARANIPPVNRTACVYSFP